jgi:hypothetical protein
MLCSIYLIKAEIDETIQYKIGLSKHPDRRFKELKTANPNIIGIDEVFVTESRDIAYKIESLMQNYYKQNKIDGEWFINIDKNEFLNLCSKFEKNAKVYFNIQEKLKQDREL